MRHSCAAVNRVEQVDALTNDRGAQVTFASALRTYLEDDAVEYVRRYMHGSEAERYSGSWFDSYPSPPTEAAQLGGVANGIDADDIIATTMLSIEVRLRSTSGFDPLKLLRLAENHAKIADLLQQLPTDTDLHELSGEQYQSLIGADQAPAAQLWTLLRDEDKIAFPPVTTFKLLARKRPRLLPLRDGLLQRALGAPPDWWRAWWEAFQADPALVDRLDDIRNAASAPTLSTLRVADVAVWMAEQDQRRPPR